MTRIQKARNAGMDPAPAIHRQIRSWLGSMLLSGCALAGPALATQIDISGPLGSNAFGSTVTVLGNGNIVVTDPNYALNNFGAVYLYSPAGVQISMLTGSTKNDHVGSGGVVALSNGNFIVSSPLWANGSAANAGAVTWVDGSNGISGIVGTDNSLVGSTQGDQVGNGGIVALTNGNVVVVSPGWANSGTSAVGAVTWMNGAIGLAAAVATGNSLIGSKAGDHVGNGGVTRLGNGNYVVASPDWSSPSTSSVGAVTWASGTAALATSVAQANSLIGSKANDHVGNGGVTALTNGNYVAISPNWTNATHSSAGAVTWASGAGGLSGAVTTANSLVGRAAGDQVGSGGVTALSNGNYVVASRLWDGDSAADVGAATWGSGSTGIAGEVSAGNSLVGSSISDQVSETGITALSNGNYVVASRLWDMGGSANVGAVTWGNGAGGISGIVSNANSLIGGTQGDRVGGGGITALSNGNFVISSPLWDSVVNVDVGAVTWVNGASGAHGTIDAGNSLIGQTASDQIGSDGVAALDNGNYVVCSSLWHNNADADVGAATWLAGNATTSDVVSTANSLIGSAPGDLVCSGGARAVGGGNFIVVSPVWSGGSIALGSVTWGTGSSALVGAVSPANSLVGATGSDQVGSGGAARQSSGDYVVRSPLWDDTGNADAGAISLGRGHGGSVGPLLGANSVIGVAPAAGATLVFAHDSVHDVLVVGQPAANQVTLFKADQLFRGGFE